MDKLYSLQNGTDIRGVAYKDDKSDLDITLTKEDVKNLVRGFCYMDYRQGQEGPD